MHSQEICYQNNIVLEKSLSVIRIRYELAARLELYALATSSMCEALVHLSQSFETRATSYTIYSAVHVYIYKAHKAVIVIRDYIVHALQRRFSEAKQMCSYCKYTLPV